MIISWCTNPGEIPALAQFFRENTGPDYISHGEMQEGRAVDAEHWSPELERALIEEMKAALDAGDSKPPQRRFLSARENGELLAFAMVLFQREALVPYAVVEDLVVQRSKRNRSTGAQVLNWIEQQAKEENCRWIFLESGIRNERAHAFFERAGFETCSVVMMKSL